MAPRHGASARRPNGWKSRWPATKMSPRSQFAAGQTPARFGPRSRMADSWKSDMGGRPMPRSANCWSYCYRTLVRVDICANGEGYLCQCGAVKAGTAPRRVASPAPAVSLGPTAHNAIARPNGPGGGSRPRRLFKPQRGAIALRIVPRWGFDEFLRAFASRPAGPGYFITGRWPFGLSSARLPGPRTSPSRSDPSRPIAAIARS